MKRKIAFGFIMVCSIALNITFVTMWLLHAAPRFLMPQRTCGVENGGCRKCPMHRTLELTDSQWCVLKPGVEAYRQMADSLRHEIAAAREAMLVELAKTPTDTAALTACMTRILNGQQKMQEKVMANVLEQKKVLTPEQHRRFIEKVRSDMSCAGFSGTAAGMAPSGKECGHGDK